MGGTWEIYGPCMTSAWPFWHVLRGVSGHVWRLVSQLKLDDATEVFSTNILELSLRVLEIQGV